MHIQLADGFDHKVVVLQKLEEINVMKRQIVRKVFCADSNHEYMSGYDS